MTADEFRAALLDRLDRQQFQPLSIETADGGRVVIDRPGTVAVRGGAAVALGPGKATTRLDAPDVVRITDGG
jgi:hypothetical protein